MTGVYCLLTELNGGCKMTTKTLRQQVLTLPNLLTLVRIALIPGIVILCLKGNAAGCTLMLLASGVTDMLDGWIARRYNAVSDLGKIIDPVADKLTVTTLLAALIPSHPALLLPLVLLVIRESTMAITGAIAISRTEQVPSARWHGKITTALLYGTMFTHILWKDIPLLASNILAAACMGMMIFSLVLYTRDNMQRIHAGKEGT